MRCSKYGDAHRQLRALTILDALMHNAGTRFQKRFADEMLLERLRILPTDDMVDLDVRNRCNQLYRGWAVTYKDTPGMQSIATLYRQLPKKQRAVANQNINNYKVIRDTEREAQENPFGTEEELEPPAPEPRAPATPPPSSRRASVAASATASPSSSSHARTPSKSTADPDYASAGIWAGLTGHSRKASKSKTKTGTPQKFSLEREKPQMLSAIAGASVASTNLLNAMRHLNRETSRVSEDPDCLKRFETCKALRRQILRYIQLVESDQWIGSLLNANDELVKALIAFEVNDKSVDDDSDSETEMYNHDGRLVLRSQGNDDDDDPHKAMSSPAPPPPQPRKHSIPHRQAPSAPTSRRGSVADDHHARRLSHDVAAMHLGGDEAPPPKPPRPEMHVDASSKRKSLPQAYVPPTPIGEGNEDDPFGDQNVL